ncbi:hypothetical protein H920_14159 [Fukomys damarensis]|uniref:Uncharacterized protein n=1 Tax=Fukomys damarensis TaxID=885580 RepID=A0A091D1S0_FUKDA|nr:hypothetical protein H920_14159 [Fukomys damarensis]
MQRAVLQGSTLSAMMRCPHSQAQGSPATRNEAPRADVNLSSSEQLPLGCGSSDRKLTTRDVSILQRQLEAGLWGWHFGCDPTVAAVSVSEGPGQSHRVPGCATPSGSRESWFWEVCRLPRGTSRDATICSSCRDGTPCRGPSQGATVSASSLPSGNRNKLSLRCDLHLVFRPGEVTLADAPPSLRRAVTAAWCRVRKEKDFQLSRRSAVELWARVQLTGLSHRCHQATPCAESVWAVEAEVRQPGDHTA